MRRLRSITLTTAHRPLARAAIASTIAFAAVLALAIPAAQAQGTLISPKVSRRHLLPCQLFRLRMEALRPVRQFRPASSA